MNKTYIKGLAYCMLATITWGCMFPIMTNALKYIDPFNFIALRHAIAGCTLALLLYLREGCGSFNLKKERWMLAWLFGTLGFAGYGFLIFQGQRIIGFNGALNASIIMAIMPMLTVLMMWILKRKRPNLSTLGLFTVSLVGVLLVNTNANVIVAFQSMGNFKGHILLILSSFCWVLYTMGGSYFPDWSPIRYTTITLLLGLISVATINSVLLHIDYIKLPQRTLLYTISPHLLYMSLLAGVVAVLSWNAGNKIVTASNGALFMNIVPITTFIVSTLNGVTPTYIQVLGMFLTISALVLNSLNQRRINLIKEISNKELSTVHQSEPPK
ncbi:DMT family transporter [Vagococcus sp. WN89Y]|uniref:DMT family transporter n=1 Tax=Vagococcus sp. WN89Y TaxID=3457258 RepID=UPI003FCEA990